MKKTLSKEDTPAHEYQALEQALKRSQRWAALSITALILSAPAQLLVGLTAYSLKDPEIINNISYVAEDGRVITERADLSVPTIDQSMKFVRSCLRKTLNITSTQYEKELEDTRYCYDRRTYLQNFQLLQSFVERDFTRNRIVGGYVVKNIDVVFSHDTSSVVRERGCTREDVANWGRATDCRTFKVEIDMEAVNFATGTKAKMPYKGRVDLILGTRQDFVNGMQIIWSDNTAQGV